jgi:GNAT superfamily N-acetyltransferase
LFRFFREEDGKMLGFAHFRYDMDFDDEVLYVYEIQLEEEFQRKGLGRFMMQVLIGLKKSKKMSELHLKWSEVNNFQYNIYVQTFKD